MKSIRQANVLLFAINGLLIFGAIHWLGCVTPPPQQQEPDKPGYLYSTTWNGVSVSTGNQQYPASQDIDGKVGYPLSVGSLWARGVGGWSCTFQVVSGELPPGLSFDNNYNVSGIPTQRGHWIIHLRATNICTDAFQYHYDDIDMIFRFHITGSGEVNE